PHSPQCLTFYISRSVALCHLHSFPTRRSSDLSYERMQGVPMSEAFASTLHIDFDVRGGFLMRQIHMLRVFFTGAFRKPRELNWLDRKSTRLNSSHVSISYAVFCWKKKRRPAHT